MNILFNFYKSLISCNFSNNIYATLFSEELEEYAINFHLQHALGGDETHQLI